MSILQRLGAFFLDILQVVIFSVSIFFFIYLVILQPHKIKGDSMQPNFPDGEYLLTNKLTYRFEAPKRGDVVVFAAPNAPGEDYIKRIIALPGERVKVENGRVYINDNLLSETYISDVLPTFSNAFAKEGATLVVPENSYFVLGDNRPHSSDSRMWGFVPRGKITGKAWFIYWPPQKSGVVQAVEYSY